MELLLEAHSGIAGDMFLAALLDLGVAPERLDTELRKLAIPEAWTMDVQRVKRHGIVANHVRFLVNGSPVEGSYLPSDNLPGKTHGNILRRHGHDHSHDHDHDHEHHADHTHTAHSHGHGRNYAEIVRLIEASALTQGAKERALRAFRVIGEAEAKLHGIPLDQVHFHEVGSLDAILDICGVAAALDLLGVTRIYCMPLPVPNGAMRMAHGMLPIPAPATVEILKGFPLRRTDLRFELVTPTGAGLVVALASAEVPQQYRVEKVGYGAGTKDPKEIANFLRVFQVQTDAGVGLQTIVVLETTVDDATPEWIAALCEKLRSEGALDVFSTPVFMKKGRQGVNITVLAEPQSADRLAAVCFENSTTIGVRTRLEQRRVLPRRAGKVDTPWGQVDVKIVTLPDGRERATPEYESCARLASQSGVSLIEIYRAAAAQTSWES